MLIEPASPDDRCRFGLLWRAYLTESHELGSPILPTERSLQFFMGLFDNIIGGPLEGVVLLARDPDEGAVGGLMRARIDLPYDFDGGPVATGFGTYVGPPWRGRGVASLLHREALQWCQAKGFRGYISSYHPGNEGSRRLLAGQDARTLETAVLVEVPGGPAQ